MRIAGVADSGELLPPPPPPPSKEAGIYGCRREKNTLIRSITNRCYKATPAARQTSQNAHLYSTECSVRINMNVDPPSSWIVVAFPPRRLRYGTDI